MKQYYEQFNKEMIVDRERNLGIPKDPGNIHYQKFLEEIKNGKAELVPHVEPSLTWDDIRHKRDQLLKDSDWTVLEGAQPKPNKEAWLNYRQALRDVPQNFPTPEAVVWPTKPS